MNTIDIKVLERALSAGELTFHYQPRIDLLNGKLAGAEALVRWVRPDGTIVPPCEFIPLAERAGFITTITTVLIEDVVAHIQPLIAQRPELTISFNASSADLKTPYLARKLAGYIAEQRLSPRQFEIEMTETIMIRNRKRVSKNLAELRALGIGLALDDFGSGYSSFDVLCDHPFTVIKIDRRLTGGIDDNPRYRAAVRAVTELVRGFGMRTVAEGVETAAQFETARDLGCDEGQGFLIARPMPRADFRELLRTDALLSDVMSGATAGMP